MVGNIEYKVNRPSVKPPEKRKYSLFAKEIDSLHNKNLDSMKKELLRAYNIGDIKKDEYLALLKKIREKQDKKDYLEKEKTNTKDEEKDSEKIKKYKERDYYFENTYEEKKEKLEEKDKEPKMESAKPIETEGFFSKLIANANIRTALFVVGMFGLLFVVTKDVLSSQGNGTLFIFAIVLVGLLVIVGSSSSKKDGLY